MTNVTIKGIIYPLRFDLYAMEMMEEESGDAQEAIEKFKKRKQIREIRQMFRILANSARNFMEEEENVTGKEILHCDMAELREISAAIQAEMARSMHISTAMGNEGDDQHHDVYLEMMEAEEAKNGETGEG